MSADSALALDLTDGILKVWKRGARSAMEGRDPLGILGFSQTPA
jgi:hypothetical protein